MHAAKPEHDVARRYGVSRALLFTLSVLLSAACAEERAASTASALNGESQSPQLRAAFERWRAGISRLASEFEPGVRLGIELDETRADFSATSELKPARRIVVRAGVLESRELSADGLALLLCHELGHHYGGYPFMDEAAQLAAEGSADYFATRVCAPYLFALEPLQLPAADPEAAARCADAGETCPRLLAAALSLADALAIHFGAAEGSVPPYAELAGEPSLASANEDAFRVARTVGAHYPSVQCRLDTFVHGALCGLEHAATERAPAQAEAAALAQSCSVESFEPGARPGCWFREGSSPTGPLDALDSVWRAVE